MSKLRQTHIAVLKEYELKDISEWEYLKADAESFTFKNIISGKVIYLRR